MGAPSRYSVTDVTPESITIKDLGPWNRHLTITNDAEGVVKRMVPHLKGRRLFYIDSEGETDELVIKKGQFAGFKPGPGRKG